MAENEIPGKSAKVASIFRQNAIFLSEEFSKLIGDLVLNPQKSGHILQEFPGPPGGTIFSNPIVRST